MRSTAQTRSGRAATPSRGLLALVALALLAVLLVTSSGAAPAPPTGTAAVSGGPQFVNDKAGVVFTFIVENTGTVPIGGVQISRPSDKWRLEDCLQMPTNWKVNGSDDGKCRFRSQKDPGDDILPGQSATFSLRATTRDSSADRTGQWQVRLARTDKFDNPNSSIATPAGGGLGAIAYSFEILDAVVAAGPATPGSPCPAANRQAIGGATVTIVVCGKNRTSAKLTPTAAQSSLGGTFVGSVGGPFTSGLINQHSAASVVLGNWADVVVAGAKGTGKTIVTTTGASASETSPSTTLGGYEVTNQAPTAVAASTTTLEDTATTLPLSGSDEDGDNLTFALSTPAAKAASTSITGLSCNGLTPSTCTATLNYTPLANANGTDAFAYRANDGFSLSAPAALQVDITPVNDEPGFSLPASPDQSVNEDAGVQAVAGFASAISAGPANESGQTVTFHVSNDNNGLFSAQPAIDETTGNLSYTPAPDANGSALVSVHLTDDGGTANFGDDTSPTQTFEITVVPVNDPPSFQLPATPDQTVLEDAGAQTVAGFATSISTGPADEAGQALTFHVANNDNSLFSVQPDIDETTGDLTFTPAPDANGSATVSVFLSDDGGGSDTSGTQQFTITVTPVNDAPSFDPLAGDPPAVDEDTLAATAAGLATGMSAGPADESGQALHFEVVSNSNPALFDGVLGLPAVDAITGNLTYKPAADANGTAVVEIKLVDDGGTADGGDDESPTQTFTITVNPVNDPPSFQLPASPDQTVLEDSGAQTVAGFATSISKGPADEATQALTFHVSNGNNALFAVQPDIDETTGDLTFTPAPDANGSATVSVYLSDDGGTAGGGDDTSGTQQFTITVTAVNDAPSFALPASPDQTVVQDSGPQTVAGFATSIIAGPADESGQTLTFHVSNDDNALFATQPTIDPGSGDLTYESAAGATGSALVSVFLSDDGGGDDTSATQTFTITIAPPNATPVAVAQTGAGAVTAVEDQVEQITLTGTDADGDALTFSVVGSPLKGSLGNWGPVNCVGSPSTCTQTVDYTPSADANGLDNFTFKANDGLVDSSTAFVEITITPVNDAPSFVKGADENVLEDSGAQTVGGWATSISPGPSDEFLQLVTFEVTGNTNPALFSVGPAVSTAGELTYTLAADAYGSATITLHAHDTGGVANGGVENGPDVTFEIVVGPVNDAPSFDTLAGNPPAANEDAGLQTVPGFATGMSAGPGNESGQALSFAVTGNTNTGLFSGGPAVSPSGTLTYTPAADANGTATITVKLTDDGGTSDGGVDESPTQQFTITVNAVNDSPSFTSGGDVSVAEDSGAYSAAWATAINPGPADESGQAVSFSVTGNTNAALFASGPTVASDGTLEFTPAANATGEATITVKAVDDGAPIAESALQSFKITLTPVNDAPVNTVPAAPSVNEDTALLFTGGNAVSVADLDAGAGAMQIQLGITNGTLTMTTLAGLSFTVGDGTADTAMTFTGTLAAVNTALGTLRFDPTPNFPGAAASGTALFSITSNDQGNTGTGGPLGDTDGSTITVNQVNDPPVGGTDSAQTVGNVQLFYDVIPGAGVPATTKTTAGAADGVLDNDSDPVEGSAVSVSAVVGCVDASAPFDCATAGGGEITLNANGTFTYRPDAGDTAADSFQYVLTDTGIPSPASANVTVNLTFVGNRVWFVKNDAGAGGLGRSNDPFDTLAEAQAAASAGGDRVFVYAGDGTTTGQNGGFAFAAAGQTLQGQGVALTTGTTVNGIADATLVAAGSQPLIGNAGGNGVTMAAGGGTVTGLSIAGSTNAVDLTTVAAATGTYTITSNTIRAAAASGLEVNLNAGTTGTITLAITNNTWNTAGTHTGISAIYVNRAAGTLNVDVTGNTNIVSTVGAGILIFGGSVASTTITGFAGNSVHGNTAGSGVQISNVTFDQTPGGAIQPVDGDNLPIGTSVNPVGGAGLTAGALQGSLFFDDLDIYAGTSGVGLSGTGTGLTFAVAPAAPDGAGTSTIDADNGPAVDIGTATVDLRLFDLQSNTTAAGVSLSSVGGQFRAPAGSSITKSGGAGTAFSVASSASGATIAYAGTLNVTSGAGVSLTSNTGSTVSFSGTLTLSTGANPAFTATGGGTVSVTGSANTLATTTGTALNVANTTIGASGLAFRSISAGTGASGPASGIILNNTGSSGGLTVAGTGSSGSGGTIQRAGTGISLTSTRDVNLSWMQLNDHSDFAIRGSAVVNFTLANSVVNGANGTDPAADEGSVRFTGLTGSASVTSSSISGGVEDNFAVVNNTGSLNRLTITGTTFGANATATGDNSVFIEASGSAVLNTTIQNSFVTASRADLLDARIGTGATGSMDVVLSGTAFSNNHAAPIAGGGGVLLGGTGGSMTYNVSSNTFRDASGTALVISCGNAGSSCSGRVENNQVGLTATANSGSSGGSGIALVSAAGGTFTTLVNNNTVRQYNNHGILLQAGDILGNPLSFNATVTNNSVANPGTINTNFNGVHLNNGTVATDNFTSCVDIRTNSIAGSGTGAISPNNADFRLRQRQATTVRLPGYVGANNNDAAVVSFVSGQQTTVTTGAASNTVATGGGGFVGGAACTQPS